MKAVRAGITALMITLAGVTVARADTPQADLRIQVQEVVYEVRPDGSARPIDHIVHDVFDVRFEKQYDSVDRESENLSFGAVYFEVPRGDDEGPDYNVYLYLRDETHEVVADGYRNKDVPGALFKLTTMLMKRDGDRAYARLVHCFAPQGGRAAEDVAASLATRQVSRHLDEKVRRYLAAQRVMTP